MRVEVAGLFDFGPASVLQQTRTPKLQLQLLQVTPRDRGEHVDHLIGSAGTPSGSRLWRSVFCGVVPKQIQPLADFVVRLL